MKNKLIIYGLVSLAVLTFASCRKDAYVHFGEQYKKIIYIVNSQNVEYKKEHSFEKVNDTLNISVYCSTTEPPAEDVRVLLKLDAAALDSINNLNALGNSRYVPKQLLPASFYTLTDLTAVIKKSEQYGVLPVRVNLTGIDPDVEYILPLSIVSNDKGYDINPKLRTILYHPVLVNHYSGYYSGSSKNESEATPKVISPVLKAMSKDVVRLPIHNLADDTSKLATNYMLLTIGSDRRSVAISSYRQSQVTDLGSSTFDEATQTFTLNYFYMSGSTKITVAALIRNIEAIEEEL